MTRVMVIGIDGGTFRLIDPLLQDGQLPTFARLIQEGVRSTLRSTIRPLSPPAWSSFMTGKNPGKHGVYGFFEARSDSYALKVANSRSIKARTLWEILSKGGRRVVTFNIPMTHPPYPVNGFMVSQLISPSMGEEFTFPPELSERIKSQFPTYLEGLKVDPSRERDIHRKKELILESMRRSTEERKRVMLYLMSEGYWDAFATVFTETDRLQHFLWADMDPTHPQYHAPGPKHRTAIQEHYRDLDSMVEKVLEALGGDTILFIVSDHGFVGVHKQFHINHWLASQGLLTIRGRMTQSSIELASRLRGSPLYRPLRKAALAIPSSRLKSRLRAATKTKLIKGSLFERDIDWEQTKAYWIPGQGIRINLLGREPQGIVAPDDYSSLRESIKEALYEVVDPETNEQVVEYVYEREAIYDGPFLERAPDLVVELHRDEDSARSYTFSARIDLQHLDGIVGVINRKSGEHHPDGILLAWGPHIVRGLKLEGAQIVDLAPTILYSLGLSVPSDMDGRILEEIFTPDFKEQNPPRYLEAEEEILTREYAYSQEEEGDIRERLRGLGYLD